MPVRPARAARSAAPRHRLHREASPRRRRTTLLAAAVLAASTSLGGVLAASPAQAAGPWFVAENGANGNTCLSAAAPCATLTAVLAKPGFQAGDTVNVAAGSYADRPLVTKGVKVVGGGAGATFTGSASTSAGWALAVNAGTATVELQNVRLTGGNYQAGGALPIVSGNVRTTNTSITGSKSTAGGGVYLWAGSATLTMTGGEVSGNRATATGANLGWGGAFYVGAGTSLTLDGVTVRDNVADGAGKAYGLGGAILNVGSTTVRNSTLRANESTGPSGTSFGGAIYHNGPSLVLADDDFIANKSAIGGALATAQPVSVTNVDFDANTALAAGAVYPTAGYTQTGGSMTGNSATTNYGGAIYAPASASAPTSLSLTGVTLTGNSAPTAGGALYATANVTTTIRDSVVDGNSSQSGGGIYNAGTITVRDSKVRNNAASFQGGGLTNGSTVVADTPSATVIDTVVTGNSAAVAGGGLQNLTRATLAVTGGRVEGNSAAGGGGIVVGDASTATLTRATVSGNTATSLGGGGVFNAGSLSVVRSQLATNKALGSSGIGGAIYSGSSTANATTSLQVDASTLSANQAYGGSAVVVYSTGSGATNTATIARSTIDGNTSTSQYGAIEQVGRPVTITDSTITGNTAAAGGAGGLATGAPAGGGVSGTVFSGNTPRACSGPVVNNGGNHAGPGDTGCGVATSADPELGPLADNGGPTPTRLPSSSSPLLDRLTCGSGADQRGTARPQGAKCDIGAVEREQVVPTVDGPDHVDLAVGSPANPAATVTATGSPEPTLSARGLPAGLSFTDNGDGTGTLSGTPATGTGGVHTVTVTATNEAGSGHADIEVEIAEAPRLSGPSASTYTVGEPGGPDVFEQTGGHPVATITTGSDLPDGVALTDNGDGTGTLAGTPQPGTGGEYAITVKGSNGVGADATWPFALTVEEAPSLDVAAVTTARVGTTTGIDLTVGGFPHPEVTAEGLPAGLAVDGDTITGTPAPGTGGVHEVSLTATNGVGDDATATTSLTVEEAASVEGPAAVRFVSGRAGSFTYAAGGFPVAALTVTGSLPAGLSFVDNGDGTATLSGTTTAVGERTVTVRASNGIGAVATLEVTLVVAPPVAISTTSLPDAAVGTAYDVTVGVTGGDAPYTFSLASGSLPAGLQLTADGRISGSPTGDPGTSTFTVRVTDGGTPAASATRQLSITVGKGATSLVGGPVVILGNVLLGGELTAVLTGGTATPIAGATVTFRGTNAMLGDPLLCTAITDANGVARCKPSLVAITQILLLVPSVKIAYAGSARWQPSSTVVVKKLG
ncbi:hypothetical protein CFH99_09590 [Nocardioides aromaticivorans]|uniref:PKD/Chitinase domain-containing protein n=1 Tax=Nocardioides aromaticivorans TaxID=200618 RepID=A0ABX7PJE0_9ACTN|nr:putative Ig domain-containing protein [Nocardioides aromaticivorans]QSR25875.1 hypothetical protein CFH99_09590 [Nocardioides aromaticivorans]